MYCTQLAENTGCEKVHKNLPSGLHRTTLSGCVFATKTHIDNRKKLVKQQYLLHVSSQYGEPHQWLRSVYQFGAPQQISTGFPYWLRYGSDVAHRRTTKLCTMFDRLLGCYTVYTFQRILSPNGILPGTKVTLCPSLAFSYIGSVTAWHSSSGHQPNFAAWYKEWNYSFSFLSSFFLLSFLYLYLLTCLFSAVADWMCTILPRMVCPQCKCKMCTGLKHAARSSVKIHDAKITKNLPSGHHRTTLSGNIFATRAHIDNRKKTKIPTELIIQLIIQNSILNIK